MGCDLSKKEVLLLDQRTTALSGGLGTKNVRYMYQERKKEREEGGYDYRMQKKERDEGIWHKRGRSEEDVKEKERKRLIA